MFFLLLLGKVMSVGWVGLRVWENDIPRTLQLVLDPLQRAASLSTLFEGYRVRQGRFLSILLVQKDAWGWSVGKNLETSQECGAGELSIACAPRAPNPLELSMDVPFGVATETLVLPEGLEGRWRREGRLEVVAEPRHCLVFSRAWLQLLQL